MDSLFVLLRVVLSLGVVIAILLVAKNRIAKGRSTRTRSNPVQLIGRQALGAKAAVVIVDIDGQRYVLGVTEHAVSLIESSAAPDRVFAEALSRVERAAPDSLSSAEPALSAVTPPALAAVPDLRVVTSSAPTETRARGRRAISRSVGGSILDPAIWRQAAGTLRSAR